MRRVPLLILITMIGAGLRLAALDWQPLWLDEATDATFALRRFWNCVFAEFVHPPLYRTLLHFMIGGFGDSIFVLRLLPAVFGILTIPLVGSLARRLNPQAETPASVLVASSAFLIYFSQENRDYSLFILLSVAATLVFLRFRDERKGILLYCCLSILLLYTHYLAIFVLLAHEIVFWVFSRQQIRQWMLCRIIAFLAFLPWLYWVAGQYHSESRLFMPLGWFIPVAIGRFFVGFGIAVYDASEPTRWGPTRIIQEITVISFSLSVFGWLLWQGFKVVVKDRIKAVLFLGLLLIPWIILLLASPWAQLASVRYLAFQAPFFLILVAAGLCSLKRRERILANSILTVMIGFFLIAYYYAPGNFLGYPLRYGKEDWPGAAAFIRQAEVDTVIIAPDYLKIPLTRYSLGTGRAIEIPPHSSVLPDLSGAHHVAVLTARSGPAQEQLLRKMDSNYIRISEASFNAQNVIRVVVYDAARPKMARLF